MRVGTKPTTLWRANYARHRPKLMRGTRRVLAQLARGHRLGLVTSGDRNRVTRQLREYRLTQIFHARVCGGDTANKKPHPEPLLKALSKMKVDPLECVYVGDTPEDLQMARAAGVCAIAVLGPFPTEKKLRAEKPDFLLEKLEQLPELLRQLFAAQGKEKRSAITSKPDFAVQGLDGAGGFAAGGVRARSWLASVCFRLPETA